MSADNPDGYTPAEIAVARAANTIIDVAGTLLTGAAARFDQATARVERLIRCRTYVAHLDEGPEEPTDQ